MGIYSVGNVATKNALWVAISSTVAAVCLFSAVMAREAGSTVDAPRLERAVDRMVNKTERKVRQQERAAQQFVNQSKKSLNNVRKNTRQNARRIDGAW